MNAYLLALLGGALIGLAVSLMLLLNGRVTGISGIVYGAAVKPVKGDRAWRWSFVGGLFFGGLILKFIYPAAFPEALQSSSWTVPLAGLLVGGSSIGLSIRSTHSRNWLRFVP